jgi:hypothetical protein
MTYSTAVHFRRSVSGITQTWYFGIARERILERALSVKLTSEDLKELDEASRPDWDYLWDVIRDNDTNEAKLLA